jgi:decaprenylphospho-beta-D-ribofuranose 2-oxidase
MIDPFPDIPSEVKELGCYSSLYHTNPRIYYPESVAELQSIFSYAKDNPGKLTLRAGGHSFDSQSLGETLVVSMKSFNEIGEVQPDNTLTVGAGATWGSILAMLEQQGFIPAVTVTTAHATAGGTLAGDCLSRFSPAYGKEGTWIRSFELLTIGGQLLTCVRPQPNVAWPNLRREEQAFCGVISGLGYLGAVLEITYQLPPPLQPTPKRIGVKTWVTKHKSFSGLAHDLVPAAQTMSSEVSSFSDEGKHDALYSSLYASRRGGLRRAIVFKSSITTSTKRRPMLIFRIKGLRRLLGEVLVRTRLCNPAWRLFYLILRESKPYVDDLDEYTFFMDGNVRVKQLGKNLGLPMHTIQQTFVVPFDVEEEGWDVGRDRLIEWLEHSHAVFGKHKVVPSLWDVLYLPKDEDFLLSATTERAGFAVSCAFERSNSKYIERVKQAFTELADDLWQTYKGRVYLVKNVHVTRKTLAAMYGQDAVRFFELKAAMDPHCVLYNEFLERTFRDLVQCNSTAAPAQTGAQNRQTVSGRFERDTEAPREPEPAQ